MPQRAHIQKKPPTQSSHSVSPLISTSPVTPLLLPMLKNCLARAVKLAEGEDFPALSPPHSLSLCTLCFPSPPLCSPDLQLSILPLVPLKMSGMRYTKAEKKKMKEQT